jgi:hypothetical protein
VICQLYEINEYDRPAWSHGEAAGSVRLTGEAGQESQVIFSCDFAGRFFIDLAIASPFVVRDSRASLIPARFTNSESVISGDAFEASGASIAAQR